MIAENPLESLKLKNFSECFCGRKNLTNTTVIRCTNRDCNNHFHHNCMPWKLDQLKFFKCPKCIILSNDPLHQIEEILYEPSILMTEQKYGFKVSFEQYSRMNKDPSLGVEIRSLKLDGKHFFEQTWPDKAVIRVNNKAIKEFKPLHQNSSLKKRRDEKIFNRQMCSVGKNTLQIIFQNVKDGKNTKTGEDPLYVFVVLLVRKLKTQDLVEKVLKNCRLPVKESKEFIKEKFMQMKDLQISEIKVDLLCKITYTLIDVPIRGVMCTHIDCFSLKFYIQSMQANSMRKWVCPLCRKMSSSLVVDEYLMQILNEARTTGEDLTKVYFLSDGSYKFTKTTFEKQDFKDGEEQENDQGNGGNNAAVLEKQLDQNQAEEMEVLSITTMGNESPGLEREEDTVEDENTQEPIEEENRQSNEAVRPAEEENEMVSPEGIAEEERIEQIEEEINIENPIREEIGSEPVPIENSPIEEEISEPAAAIEPNPPTTNLVPENPINNSPEEPQPLQNPKTKVVANASAARVPPIQTPREEEQIANNDLNFDEYSPITVYTPAQARNMDLRTEDPEEGELGRREAPIMDEILNNEIKKKKTLWEDINFLKKYWKHFQKKKKSLNMQVNSFEDFKSNLKTLKENDVLFQKQFELLYRIIENRKKEINNPIVRRYKKLIRDLSCQDCLFNDQDYNDRSVKKIRRGKEPKEDHIQDLLSKMGLGHEDSSLVSMKRRKKGLPMTIEGNSMNNAIEIM